VKRRQEESNRGNNGVKRGLVCVKRDLVCVKIDLVCELVSLYVESRQRAARVCVCVLYIHTRIYIAQTFSRVCMHSFSLALTHFAHRGDDLGVRIRVGIPVRGLVSGN
jgi:hypothetical protein